MDKKERFNMAYNYLRKMGIIHTQKDLSEIMNASSSNISSALTGLERVLTDRFLQRFVSSTGNIFSLNWLLFGQGEMLAAPQTATQTNVHGDNHNNQTINNSDRALLEEIAAQRKLTETAQEQVNRLLTIIEKLQK